jgi:hypothetical protein
MNKAYQVIKEYSLSELSLVDNPANQFANVISVEKGQATGYLSKADVENVFWCRKDDIIQISKSDSTSCPQCEKSMDNIGFVESNDEDKASMVKGMLTKVKKSVIQKNIEENSFVKFDGDYGRVTQVIHKGGARFSSDEEPTVAKSDDPVVIIKVYSQNNGTIVPTNRRVIKNISSLEKVNAISKSEVKEVSKMDSDIVVVDEIEKSETVDPEETALPVQESDATTAETAKGYKEDKADEEEMETEKSDTPEVEKSEDMDEEEEEEKEEMAAKADTEDEIQKSEEAPVVDEAATMVKEINDTLASTLTTLAETVKALDAKIEGINKAFGGAVAEINSKVEEVQESFGKRVDAVEKDTAFRKSADLGEILQEEPQKAEKSAWGGRFLKNADLF